MADETAEAVGEDWLEALVESARAVKVTGLGGPKAQASADEILQGLESGELAEYVESCRERARAIRAGQTESPSVLDMRPGLRLVASNGRLLSS